MTSRKCRYMNLLMKISCLPFLALLLFLPAQAMADSASDRALKDYLVSPQYRNHIARQWNVVSKALCGEEAPTPTLSAGKFVLIGKKPVFGTTRKAPVTGQWMQVFSGNLCGRKQAMNFLVLFKNGAARVQHLAPGNTKASPEQQKNAMRLAKIPAMLSGCAGQPGGFDSRKVLLTDTLYLGQINPPGGPSLERWIFRACDNKVELDIHFVPQPKGPVKIFIKQVPKTAQ